ncbi:hypothetical protein [Marinococcus luteus]|uniref:hypothetical protein n=1 Tax=Marinococcus luteus TaxID=1122204 RepID=UPI002ACC3EC9|nr:hypothetical protein [Marinococcus luteus]MDZ5784467.1 hypothetical protein [Marinococcus luteus]
MSTLMEESKGLYHIIRTLSPKEENEILNHAENVNYINKQISFFLNLDTAYKEYLNWESERNHYKLERFVINYLSAFGEFINKWAKYAKRKQKENSYSVLFDYWEELRTSLFDRSFEYKLVYELRNYTQHGGEPFTSITSSENGDSIHMDKDFFIKDYTGMSKHLKRELNKMDEKEISVNNAIEKVNSELYRLQELMSSKSMEEECEENEEILASAVWIMDFYNKNQENNGELQINFTDTTSALIRGDDSLHFSTTEIPSKNAKFIATSIKAEFYLRGEKFAKSPVLPFELNNTIYRGKKVGFHRSIEWEQILESENIKNKKYYALYVPKVLNNEEKKRIRKEYLNTMRSYLKE